MRRGGDALKSKLVVAREGLSRTGTWSRWWRKERVTEGGRTEMRTCPRRALVWRRLPPELPFHVRHDLLAPGRREYLGHGTGLPIPNLTGCMRGSAAGLRTPVHGRRQLRLKSTKPSVSAGHVRAVFLRKYGPLPPCCTTATRVMTSVRVRSLADERGTRGTSGPSSSSALLGACLYPLWLGYGALRSCVTNPAALRSPSRTSSAPSLPRTTNLGRTDGDLSSAV